ncbi:MAG: hypothetical protein AAGC91_05025 [Pseudomonadota bacterium]
MAYFEFVATYYEFIETQVFTDLVNELLTDDEYRELQAFLVKSPKGGDVIPGGNGLRKLRWRSASTGKRGGYRVIYYHVALIQQIRMLLIYKKGRQENLTRDQIKILVKLMKSWEE